MCVLRSGIKGYLDAKDRSEIYRKLILSDSVVLSRSTISIKLKHMAKMAKLRDEAVANLVADQLLVKGNWFASGSVKGKITLEIGYLKGHPGNNAEAKSRFAELLASYGIDYSDFERSFTKSKTGNTPRILDMTDIKQTSWLYSSRLADIIQNNDFLRKRVKLDPMAVRQESGG